MGLQMPWITRPIWLWLVIDSCVKDLNCCYFSSLVLHSWPYFFHESGLDSDLTLASQVQILLVEETCAACALCTCTVPVPACEDIWKVNTSTEK